MTSTTLTPTVSPSAPSPASATARRSPRRYAVADALTMTWRNLLTYVRLPQLLVFSTIQPIMLVLLFRYVFGNSINLSDPTIDYVDYLMPGVFVQATVFGALGTGVGLAEDLQKGLWSGSGRCPWPGRRCWPAARSPTPPATPSCWC